jgi:hypothetical protein
VRTKTMSIYPPAPTQTSKDIDSSRRDGGRDRDSELSSWSISSPGGGGGGIIIEWVCVEYDNTISHRAIQNPAVKLLVTRTT